MTLSNSIRRENERGAAAVEMAFVLPVLMLLVLGIIQYGMYFAARQGGSDIARDAVRRSSVGDQGSCTAFRAAVRDSLQGLSGAEAASATITRTYQKDNAAYVQVGDTVVVHIAFDSFDMNLPFIPTPGNARVDTRVTARVENVSTQPEACS